MWLAVGDKNTSYFYASTKSRRAKNRVSVIENSEGNPVYEKGKIVKVISDYFLNIFTSTSPQSLDVVEKTLALCISSELNDRLTATPSDEEVKDAMFSIHSDKAPSLDGFSASFFQTNWDTLGPAISREIRSFFSTETLPNTIKRSMSDSFRR